MEKDEGSNVENLGKTMKFKSKKMQITKLRENNGDINWK